MRKVFILSGDRFFAGCLEAYLNREFSVRYFNNPFALMFGLEEELPDLIFSEVNLPGGSVFAVLNELISYPDTEKIPVVMIRDANFPRQGLKDYNIKAILEKEKLKPEEIVYYAERYTR